MKRKKSLYQAKSKPGGPLSASDACFLGAAEAMKFGAKPDCQSVSQAELRAAREALRLFDTYTDDQMAVSLLLAMVVLGRRVEQREKEAGVRKPVGRVNET